MCLKNMTARYSTLVSNGLFLSLPLALSIREMDRVFAYVEFSRKITNRIRNLAPLLLEKTAPVDKEIKTKHRYDLYTKV